MTDMIALIVLCFISFSPLILLMLDLFGLCDLVDRPRSISTPTCPDRERMSPAQEVFDVPHSKLIPVESECEIDACGTCTERKSVCRQAGANTQPGGPHR